MIVQFRNEKVSNHGSIPITIDCKRCGLHRFEEGFHQLIKRANNPFSGRNGVSTTLNGLSLLNAAAVLFVDVAIQPEVRFITKQNSLMKIDHSAIVLEAFDESTPCSGVSRFDELPNQTETNHLTAVKSVAILETVRGGDAPPFFENFVPPVKVGTIDKYSACVEVGTHRRKFRLCRVLCKSKWCRQKTSSVNFNAPSPMESKHRRACVAPENLSSPGSGNEEKEKSF
ncbi:hypothetical protein TNCV_1475621 [Trichonephila clavipes]|nr:hypothetical protein TNCV_1475621 [Trichonephila clavipes]